MWNPNRLALWIHLLIQARYAPKDSLLGGKRITLEPGQFTTGRKQLAEISGLSNSTVERVLEIFELEGMIGQRKTTTNRLISISNWNMYQEDGQQADSDRTTTGQRPDTPKECKKEKKERKHIEPPALADVISYFLENGYTEESAKKFFDYYTTGGWKDSKGNSVRVWKQKAQAVWFKPENKKLTQQERLPPSW